MMALPSFDESGPVLAPWHICSQNPCFSKNGCAKEPAQQEHEQIQGHRDPRYFK